MVEETQKTVTLHVCRAKSCTRRGAAELAAGLGEGLAQAGVDARVLRHDCFDLCKGACNVRLEVPGLEPRLYTRLHPRQAESFARSIAAEVQGDARAEPVLSG